MEGKRPSSSSGPSSSSSLDRFGWRQKMQKTESLPEFIYSLLGDPNKQRVISWGLYDTVYVETYGGLKNLIAEKFPGIDIAKTMIGYGFEYFTIPQLPTCAIFFEPTFNKFNLPRLTYSNNQPMKKHLTEVMKEMIAASVIRSVLPAVVLDHPPVDEDDEETRKMKKEVREMTVLLHRQGTNIAIVTADAQTVVAHAQTVVADAKRLGEQHVKILKTFNQLTGTIYPDHPATRNTIPLRPPSPV